MTVASARLRARNPLPVRAGWRGRMRALLVAFGLALAATVAVPSGAALLTCAYYVCAGDHVAPCVEQTGAGANVEDRVHVGAGGERRCSGTAQWHGIGATVAVPVAGLGPWVIVDAGWYAGTTSEGSFTSLHAGTNVAWWGWEQDADGCGMGLYAGGSCAAGAPPAPPELPWGHVTP